MRPPESPARFAILRHEISTNGCRTDQTHFDWMFELNGLLQTWATAPIADFGSRTEIEADKLSEHRIEYLEFEGEISGNRGAVTRVAEGSYESTANHENRFEAMLTLQNRTTGHSSHASVEFYQDVSEDGSRTDNSPSIWRMRFVPEPLSRFES